VAIQGNTSGVCRAAQNGPGDRHAAYRRLAMTGLFALNLLTCASLAARAAGPVTVAVPTFAFVDTSGEVRNQTAFHTAWTQRLATELQQDLTATGRYRGLALDCGGQPCITADNDVSDAVAKARATGASVMLFGVVEKQSTLISWMRVRAVNTATGAVLFDKFLTFRGDDDAAWQHMEAYVLREFLAANVGA